MLINRLLRRARRAIATVTAVTLVLGPFGPAVAAPTKLADIPINAKVTAKPNIVYTVDDSGSMNSTYLPDYVVNTATLVTISTLVQAGGVATVTLASAPTPPLAVGDWVIITGANQVDYNGQFQITAVLSATKFTYNVPNNPASPATGTLRYATGTMYCRAGNTTGACTQIPVYNSTFGSPPILNADFNALAYDPNVNYTPPSKYDGTPWTYNVPTVTDALGNQQYTKAQEDPYLSPGTQRDLTTKVTVPVYCNTDFPVTVGTNLAIADLGNSNGEYQAGTGAYCRINGTKYDMSAASGAPAVAADYNYPYQKTSGADNAMYFYRTMGSKTIWCDTTSPYWPRATSGGSCTTTCNVAPINVAQTCNAGGITSACCTAIGSPAGCGGVSTYNPAGCRQTPANPLYCGPFGSGSPPECLSCACNNLPTGRNGSCSITGASCGCVGAGCTILVNGNPACPNVPNYCPPANRVTTCTGPAPSAACNSQMFNPVTKLYDLNTTLLQDSNGLGRVCRHNNQVYATGGAAGLFKYPGNYPGEGAGTGNFNTAATSGGCPTVGSITIPRHYYTVDSLQFCDGLVTTANDQWRGFGTGACQPKNDLTKFRNVKYGQFDRIALVNDGRTYPYTDQLTGLASSRTYAQESVNYANWYAYYRSRILATKTTSSIAFSYLDDTYRVGFHILGHEPPPYGLSPLVPITWVNVKDFNYGAGNQRDSWYAALFGIAPTTGKTPLISAMQRVGHLFETGSAGGLPPEINPLAGAVTDPITLSCQSNYHILFTDGVTNQVAWPTVAGNKDNVTPLGWPGIVDNPPDNVLPNLRPGGAPWPLVFREKGAHPMGDSLSDIATYYWARDLRPGLKNDVPAEPGKGTGDIDPTKDVAWWQHVNFNAISFGGEGLLDNQNQSATLAAISAGTNFWTETLDSTLTTARPNSPQNPTANPGASAVDDLWHATANARGKFVYARSPLEVSYGLASILAGIQNSRKSRVGAALTGQVISTGVNDIIYESTIERGWAGDLLKVQINPANGAEIATLWQAGPQLTLQVDPVNTGQPEPWFTNRRIVTLDSAGTKVAFRHPGDSPPPTLDATQLATFAPAANPLLQRKMVAYLRGASTFQVAPIPAPATTIEGTGIGQFRKRFGILGDISNGQPVVVGKPNRPYKDSSDPGYTAYKVAQSGRATRIYVPANDGMMHVLDDATGNEVYAYVPRDIIRAGPTGMNALTYQDGGVPIYKHHFYVDSSLRAADVRFSDSSWHTIVAGGLGKGGRTWFAVDATGTAAPNETAAAGKILWEVTDPANDTVYSYSRPVIVKTRAFGGIWVMIVASGYNNVNGDGRLHFFNAQTGAHLKTMSTGSGSAANPSGLAQIHAYVKDQTNQIAEQVYGGDLNGDFWRFDVSDALDTNWTVTLFAQLRDPFGVPQPITTAPQIEIDYNNAIDRYVFIGTGQLLDQTDLANLQTQTFYAIRDGTAANPMTVGLPVTRLGAPLAPINPDGVSAIVGGAPNGWFHDLPNLYNPALGIVPGRRIVVDVAADVNIAAYIVTEPQTDPCVISLPAAFVAREYSTGESLLSQGGALKAAIGFASGAVGGPIIGRTQADGSYTLGALISGEIPGTQPVDILNPVKGSLRRLSWRLLTGE